MFDDVEASLVTCCVTVTEYFKGNNWKVHPDWVYCEYNSASDKFFSTPEERILHFLARTRRPAWKWMSLRPRSPSSHHKQASKMDKDAYYCKYLYLIDFSTNINVYKYMSRVINIGL